MKASTTAWTGCGPAIDRTAPTPPPTAAAAEARCRFRTAHCDVGAGRKNLAPIASAMRVPTTAATLMAVRTDARLAASTAWYSLSAKMPQAIAIPKAPAIASSCLGYTLSNVGAGRAVVID
jgi:hypothetical protein